MISTLVKVSLIQTLNNCSSTIKLIIFPRDTIQPKKAVFFRVQCWVWHSCTPSFPHSFLLFHPSPSRFTNHTEMPLRHEVASFGHLLEIIQDLVVKAGESWRKCWSGLHSLVPSTVTKKFTATKEVVQQCIYWILKALPLKNVLCLVYCSGLTFYPSLGQSNLK